MTESPELAEREEGMTALDWADPSDLPVEEVRDVFLTLSKALRAYQLYDPNNPVYKRFVANLGDSLNGLWESRDSIQVLVEEDRLTWMGEEVYRNESRADSLAFMLYRDGIRDLTFKAGFEEIERLLEAFHRTRNLRGEGEDLVSMLWDLEMDHFSYSAIEVGSEGAGMDLSGLGEPSAIDVSAVLENELEEESETLDEGAPGDDGGGEPLAGAVKPEDFNPTLYALDERERTYLEGELKKELARDVRTDVLSALFDRLEEPERPDRQVEIMGILRSMVPNFLSRGSLGAVGWVIREVGQIRAQSQVLSSEAEALVESLTDDLSAPEVVDELVRALEDGSVLADADELSDLLQQLRPGALTALLRGAEETRDTATADVLRRAIHGIAENNPEVVVSLLGADDLSVVSGAVRLAGRMKIAEAGNALVRLLEHGPRQVRRVVVETAIQVPSSVLASAVQRLLRDEDRELRVTAARVLGEMKYAPAEEDFRAVMGEKGFRDADVTEKVALFEAYGRLAGGKGVAFLDHILNGRGFLGRREPTELRAGAALGLGQIGGQDAMKALDRASGDVDPVVRTAVSRAQKELGAET